MERKYALFFSIAITLAVAFNYFWIIDKDEINMENVVVKRAIDGDTIELDDARIVRLSGVNTPEKKERGYEGAFDFLKSFENKSVELKILGTEKYGRLLGELYSGNLIVNREILERGLGHTLLVEDARAKDFIKVQDRAYEEEIGIWKRSEKFGCLIIKIEKKEEYVDVEDKCNIDFKGWVLKDETTQRYVFKKDMPSKFRIYSGEGIDNENEKEFYWGRGNAWNDDRDSIFILDENELLVYYSSYGY